MAKNNIPGTFVTAIVAEFELYEEGHHSWVWEVRLKNDMLVYHPVDGEAAYVPAGSVFYLPMGQFDEVKRAAITAASATTGPSTLA